MKLQRYEPRILRDDNFINRTCAALIQSDKGLAVKHSEALDWFESLLDKEEASWKKDHWLSKIVVNSVINGFRAIIAAERGKG